MRSRVAAAGLLDAADSRGYLPHALLATAAVVGMPALVVLPLAPLRGATDVLVSALIAVGLSVGAGGVGSILWSRRRDSSAMPFADLMLWSWARRVAAERRASRAARGRGHDSPDRDRRLDALRRLNAVLELGVDGSDGHAARVAGHAGRIARQLGLPAEQVARVEEAAAIHDIGKARVPRALLARDGALGAEEQRALEALHVCHGAEMAAEAGLGDLAVAVRHHHERYDGRGGPDSLAGESIPLGARILAVADAFDHLCGGRRRSRAGARNALDGLRERAGAELDPDVVSAFAAYYSSRRSIAGVAFAATAPQRVVRWLTAAPSVAGPPVPGAVPPLAQSACAAGVVALAGVCLGGAAPGGDGTQPSTRAGERPGLERQAASPARSVATVPSPRILRAGRRSRPGALGPVAGSPPSPSPAPAQPVASPDAGVRPSPPAGRAPASPASSAPSLPAAPDPSPSLDEPAVPELPAVEAPEVGDAVESVEGAVEPVAETVDDTVAPLGAPQLAPTVDGLQP